MSERLNYASNGALYSWVISAGLTIYNHSPLHFWDYFFLIITYPIFVLVWMAIYNAMEHDRKKAEDKEDAKSDEPEP